MDSTLAEARTRTTGGPGFDSRRLHGRSGASFGIPAASGADNVDGKRKWPALTQLHKGL